MKEFKGELFSQDCLFDNLDPADELVKVIGAGAITQILQDGEQASVVELLEFQDKLGMTEIVDSPFIQTVIEFV